MLKPTASPSITPEMAAQIRYLKLEKKLFNHQIAALMGINQGRVSEVMTGKLYPSVTPSQKSLFD